MQQVISGVSGSPLFKEKLFMEVSKQIEDMESSGNCCFLLSQTIEQTKDNECKKDS